jgi:hypothetical protein
MNLAWLTVIALVVRVPAAWAVSGEPTAVEVGSAFANSLVAVPVEAAESPGEVAGIGRVVDPVAFLQVVAASDVMKVAAETAERELVRVERLARADQNASERDVEAARVAALRTRADLADADARLVAAWGREASAAPGWRQVVERLARGEAALVRFDVPSGAWTGGIATSAKLSLPRAGGDVDMPAVLLGAAPSVDPTLQGRSFLVLLVSDPPAVGTVVEGRLGIQGAATIGCIVPARSVVWHEGRSFVFVEEAPRRFRRREIERIAACADGSWIVRGISVGQRIATTGVAQLLSAEMLPRPVSE